MAKMSRMLDNIGFQLAKKWIAGITITEAITESKRTNTKGKMVMINYLGESVTDVKPIKANVDTYKRLLNAMRLAKVKGCIAIKPTQLGLSISEGLCYKNCLEIARAAKKNGFFVWIDMEELKYVAGTITTYFRLLKKQDNIGICIQAKLKRSFDDAKKIAANGGKIRLVKGAYTGPITVMYQKRSEVYANYLKIMKYLFATSNHFIIATHDDKLIKEAQRLAKLYHKQFSFAMLKGIRENLAAKLAKTNEIFIYLPFGKEWFAYSARRLKERNNLLLVARSVFQQ